MLGKTHSIETRNKISRALTGIKFSDERKLKIKLTHKGMLGKHHSEESKKKMSISQTGKSLGRKHTEEAKNKIKEFYRLHPERHANHIMAQKGFISKPQKYLYNNVAKKFTDAIMEYPIITKKCTRYIDVAVPSKKLAFEFDGKQFHEGKEERDNIRQKEIENEGWKVYRFNENNLDNAESIISVI